MYSLKRRNIERKTESEVVRDKLIEQGFVLLGSAAEIQEKSSKKQLEKMTAPELKALAKERGLQGYASLKKDELLAVLKGADDNDRDGEAESSDGE